MNTEKLKILAIGMNYELRETYLDRSIEGETIKLIQVLNNDPSKAPHWVTYNPLTNDSQCMEIIGKLKSLVCSVEILSIVDGWIFRIYESEIGFPAIESEGKTINEAVCRYAVEYFKDKS